MEQQLIQLNGVENVRDLGGIVVRGKKKVKTGLLYRGANLSNISLDAQRVFSQELGISLVVDLRVSWEARAKPDVEMPGVVYRHIPFYDKEIVGIEYTHQAPGTIRIGNDIACDPHHFYADMANSLTAAQTGQAVQLMLTHALEYRACYVHCSGGKDRAGIVAFWILYILGASKQEILRDYLLTNISREAHIDTTYDRFLKLCNGNQDHAREITRAHAARAENIEAYVASIKNHYRNLDAFLFEAMKVPPILVDRARTELTEHV